MYDGDGIDAAYQRARQRAMAYTLPGNVQVVRSNGPTTPAEVFRRASRMMDYEDELLRLRGEWIKPVPVPAKPWSVWDYLRRFHLPKRRG